MRLRTKSCYRFSWLALISLAALGGCAVGPDYVRPEVDVPAAYKEAPADATWQPAAAQGELPPGAWWTRFGDARLNDLVEQVAVNNQNVQAAAASYRQALASLETSRAARWPSLDASLGSSRGVAAGNGSNGNAPAGPTRTTDRVALTANWEADLWGRIGRDAEAGEALAAAGAADLQGALLSAQAMLAQNYLQLRIVDSQRRLYERSVTEYRRALEITRNRYEAGVAGRSDVVQAEAQLRTAEAQRLDFTLQRARLEHAIATLLGKPPAEFSLAEETAVPQLPAIPPGLPSQLLERRPDIAAAERRMAAANARIGVAQAAYFPALTIAGTLGYQNDRFAQLLTAPHRFWSLGPVLALTLLDGGARSAAKAGALAAYDRQVAEYRQSVLEAFRDVEDALVTLRLLTQEAEVQQQALAAAQELVRLGNNQYLAGMVSYLHVATAQTDALAAERSTLEIHGRRLEAGVALLKAIGGDWQIPAAAQAGAAQGSE